MQNMQCNVSSLMLLLANLVILFVVEYYFIASCNKSSRSNVVFILEMALVFWFMKMRLYSCRELLRINSVEITECFVWLHCLWTFWCRPHGMIDSSHLMLDCMLVDCSKS